MIYCLGNSISYAMVEGATIVLDLNRDRYLRLGREAASALDALARGAHVDPENTQGLDVLLRSNIIADAPGLPIAPVAVAQPVSNALEAAECPSPRLGLMTIALAGLTIRRSLARRGLAVTLARLQQARAQAELRNDECQAVGIAQRYARGRRLLPGSRGCVPESLALSVLLTKRGIAHDVVFGVSLAPFAAHAWTQTAQHVLNDRGDPLHAFHPVFRL